MNNTLRINLLSESVEEVKQRLSASSNNVILSLEASDLSLWSGSGVNEILRAVLRHLQDNYKREYFWWIF